MKPDEEMGTNDAKAAGAERRFEGASAGALLQGGRGTRSGLEVWKHLMIPVATLVVAVLVFLFGTDVVGRHDGVGMPEAPDGDSVAIESTNQRGSRQHATYSFKTAPFVHPKIIDDLVGWLSDSGDQVVAINLLDSQDSNRYFGEIVVSPQLNPMTPSWPWVYSVDGDENADKTLDELWGRPWYAYRYVGSTQAGLDVVHARHSGGGSGIFNSVVFIRTEMDRGVDYPPLSEVESWTAAAQPEVSDRELVRFVGKIPLGDRWQGTVEVVGNDVVVRGRDLHERCVLGGTTTKEAVEMEQFMEMGCRDGPAAQPPPARVYKAPGRASWTTHAGQ